MGVREIRRKEFFCDRCNTELTPEYHEIDGVKIPGTEMLPNTCHIKISFPKKERLGIPAATDSMSIDWTHLCVTCEEAVFITLAKLQKVN